MDYLQHLNIKMDDEIKELIPLKKIWVVNNNEE